MNEESLQRLDPPRRLGKLRLLARLGEGGMASVYLAAVGDGPLARLCAVKLVRGDVADKEYRSRFLDEAKVVVQLHHNNIVDVHEAGELGEQLYITMELVEGRDLGRIWEACAEAERSFPIPLAVHLVREVLRGLHYAHTHTGLGLVHRDVSPSNILVDWAGAVRLADFGLATSVLKATHTLPGMVYGKLGYMAPEQALRVPLDGRADAYACGVVLWELVTGRPLRQMRVDTGEIAKFVAKPVHEVSRRVDPHLAGIIARSLANRREDRYATAHEFMSALSGWLAEHAPRTTQEDLAAFVAELYGDRAVRDRQAFAELLEQSRKGASGPTVVPPPSPDAAAARRTPARVDDFELPPPLEETIPAGVVIADRYRVERKIGRGGMGTVYLGEHLTVGRKVAIKVLSHEWSSNEVIARRFRDEARAASAVGHPNIVEVFDAGALDDGRLYLVMEYLTGNSLYDEIERDGRLSLPRALGVMREITRAIVAAHAAGIIHRDLKPDNVMIVRQLDGERVKVLDFGISASMEEIKRDARLTGPGRCLGTPEYMAPEQGSGGPTTVAFDIYALGVMLYECLIGEPPIMSHNLKELLERKLSEEAPDVTDGRTDVPPGVAFLIRECLARDPEHRPQSAAEVLERLTLLADGIGGQERTGAIRSAGTLEGRSVSFDAAPVVDVPPRAAARLSGGPATRGRRIATGMVAGLLALVAASTWWRTETGDGSVSVEVRPANARGLAPAAPLAAKLEPRSTARVLDVIALPPKPAAPALEAAPAEARSDEPARRPRARRAADPATSASCAQQRELARKADRAGDYRGALVHLQRRSCWRPEERVEFDRMRTKALFETEQWDACARAGASSKDPSVRRTVQICRQRGSWSG